jgi:predicted phage terminase large subunit-like protein
MEGSGPPVGYYLVNVWRARVEFAALKRQALALFEQYHPDVVLIEDSASGQSLLQELRTTLLPIKSIKPDADKLARAASVTPAMEGGHFWVLEGAAWLDDYIAEMTAFPGAAHDDLVDATTQALTFLRQPPEPGIIGFYREMAKRNRTGTASDSHELMDEYTRIRSELEAGYCDNCGVSLLHKSLSSDGFRKFCIPCKPAEWL